MSFSKQKSNNMFAKEIHRILKRKTFLVCGLSIYSEIPVRLALLPVSYIIIFFYYFIFFFHNRTAFVTKMFFTLSNTGKDFIWPGYESDRCHIKQQAPSDFYVIFSTQFEAQVLLIIYLCYKTIKERKKERK